MVNLAVEWAGPNFSLSTLAKELNAKFDAPKRAYEYVTGYKSAANVSGHNADNNGRGHSMDIFVGAGQNISVEQGIDLAERLRLEGKKGDIPGHPDRLAYIIHRGRIAGDHTNWEWVAYNGIADHYDHIHVSSVFDYYWGDPVAGNPADYNSTQAWNLWGATSGQGSDITPIPKEELSMADINTILGWINTVHNAVRDNATATNKKIDETKAAVQGDLNTVHNAIRRDVGGQLAGLREAITQLPGGKDIDLAAVEAAAKRGAESALAEGVDVNVSVGGSK